MNKQEIRELLVEPLAEYAKEKIEHDLEVLEILKDVVVVSPMTIRAIEVSESYKEYEYNCKIMRCLTGTKTVYNKIKEWLDNE